jgi:CRISPR-associated exonuclease Cas4
MTDPLVPVAVLAIGVLVVAAGAISLRRGRHDRRLGQLVAVDAGRAVTLRSERYRLAGRPDAVRRRSDGALVPVELKHRAVPPRGPYPSHEIQLGAYCLLVEDATGRSPPFGVLRYADGEVVVPWDDRHRRRLVGLLEEVAAPYDGRATPSPGKCSGCVWSPSCDASLAPALRGR